MSQSSALKVPKQRLEVELRLRGQEPRRVEIFVSDQHPGSRRRLDVLAALEQDEGFMPARDVDAGEWILVNKRALLWIALEQASEEGVVEVELFDQRLPVQAVFENGSKQEGELLFSPPATGRRAVDHLNREEPFFCLFCGERVFIVNKTALVALVEVQVSEPSGESRGED